MSEVTLYRGYGVGVYMGDPRTRTRSPLGGYSRGLFLEARKEAPLSPELSGPVRAQGLEFGTVPSALWWS